MIEIVGATRLSEDEFWKKSALGLSLQRLSQDPRLVARIAFENRRGLPDVFNARIQAQEDHDILIFMHDDVWIDDYYLADRVIDGLRVYDVIGVAGNRRRVQNQPGWAFVDDKFIWDSKGNLSGSIAHGRDPFGKVIVYGSAPADCELLDGVFLAARKSTLMDNEVLFDPRFDFHFYDMDFCRNARTKGLRLGTWPLCLTHQSGGAFSSPAWVEKRRMYQEKWKFSETMMEKPDRVAPTAPDLQKSIRSVLEHHKMFQSALEHQKAGRFPEAKVMCQQILHTKQDYHKALHLLGLIAHQEGENDNAIELISRAIQVSSPMPGYYYNLGCIYNALNKLDDAGACYRKALAIKPDYADALNNLGNTLKAQGKLDEAITYYHKALAIKPDDTAAFTNLGITFKEQGNFDEAIACYRKALAIKPDDTAALNSLGIVFKDQNKLDEAAACYHKALAIKPDYADALNNLGNIHKEQGTLDEAVTCYQRALAIKPDDAMTNHNLGNTLKDMGRLDEAITCYQKALMIKPDFAEAHNNKLLAAHYATLHSPADLFVEHLKFAEQFEAPLKPSWRPHPNSRDPEKRLKVGYVSPDFRHHAVAYFVEPVLAHHDKSRVEVFCYYNHTRHDSFTDRLMATADHWVPCKDLSDDRLAERIRADGIDILVDLTGHTGENRLLVFARKPAPVQVTYLGYISTTGLSAMDYRLTHIDSDPSGNEAHYSETLYRLPGDLWWCYRPMLGMPGVTTSPVISNGFVTFGSTNYFAKLSPETIATWADILRALPDVRLIVAGVPQGSAQQSLYERFSAHGVEPRRLTVHGRLSLRQFWELHHQIDIILDPFPYNGGTTTCDALWLGVPAVALTGQTFVSRMGYALLKNIGLPELAADSRQDYVKIAVNLAGNLERLKTLRAGMRERLAASPLRDEAGFTRNLEAAYREMWRKWCTGVQSKPDRPPP
jgi:predicted O-linked N-acetylglucosamine transferase (SPINDLY family)